MRSIHSQGYPRLEHIVIDGGSTDGSLEVLLGYADRLAWWCSEKDSGHGEALAKGLQRAKGEILTWICSDDLLLPGALFSVADYFRKHPQEDWVAGDGLKIDEDSRILRLIYGMPLTHSGLVHWTFGGAVQPSIFVRKEAFRRAGGLGEHLDLAPDFDLALRLARHRPSGYWPRFLGALRIHNQTQTMQKNDQLQRVAAGLRQRELRFCGRSGVSWLQGRRALARYAATRIWRLSRDVVAPSGYRVGERLDACISAGTATGEQQEARASAPYTANL